MISIIPKPKVVSETAGCFKLLPSTRIIASDPTAACLRRLLTTAAGFQLASGDEREATNVIRATLVEPVRSTVPGAYRLKVTPERIEISAADEAGLFYAAQTLRQLLPVQIFSPVHVQNVEWTMPCVEIEDAPRYQWRGVMLDCSRHFFDAGFIKQFIDNLALHKFNIFHWHLTDDQGWRVEIKKYPKLTEVGGWRNETVVGHSNDRPQRFDGIKHGGFYTQEQVREIVAFAAERHVTVVPEIELPGHSRAAIAAYPELGNVKEPISVGTVWGVEKHILNAEETTLRFYENVFAEVLDLFPSQYIHVGGDEAIKDEWKATPRVQERIRELGLKDENELQSHMIRRIDSFLTRNGRRLLGWDEILEGGISENATVMSWRSETGAVEAARLGHDVVMCRKDQSYLDYYQSEDKASEPLAIHGYLPLEKAYGFEVMPKGLTPAQVAHVLGGQAQVWTEYMPTPQRLFYMVYPRAMAIAEGLWTAENQRSYSDFQSRLPYHIQALRFRGIEGRPLASGHALLKAAPRHSLERLHFVQPQPN